MVAGDGFGGCDWEVRQQPGFDGWDEWIAMTSESSACVSVTGICLR